MKKLLLILAFIAPLLVTLGAIIYTLKCEPMSEGIAVGLGMLFIIAIFELIGYGAILIYWLHEKIEKKFENSLQSSE